MTYGQVSEKQMMNEMLLIYSPFGGFVWKQILGTLMGKPRVVLQYIHMHLMLIWCDFTHKSEAVVLHVLGLLKMACAGLFWYKIYMWF